MKPHARKHCRNGHAVRRDLGVMRATGFVNKFCEKFFYPPAVACAPVRKFERFTAFVIWQQLFTEIII